MKKILSMILVVAMVLSTMSVAVFAEESENTEVETSTELLSEEVTEESAEEIAEESSEGGAGESSNEEESTAVYVASVDGTDYETIEEAIAAWKHNTTLTLLSDVTITSTISLASTEKHTLNLDKYTLTAEKCDAISFNVLGTNMATALVIDSADDNSGTISASGKACIKHAKPTSNAPSKDRPGIVINGGTFEGAYAIKQGGSGWGSGYTGASAPTITINGGVFNAPISTNRSKINIYGGTFNSSGNSMSVDSTAHVNLIGGRFKTIKNAAGSDLYDKMANQTTVKDMKNIHKWTIGSAQGVYDREIYIDSEGYINVVEDASQANANAKAAFELIFNDSDKKNCTLYYSKYNPNPVYTVDPTYVNTWTEDYKYIYCLDANAAVDFILNTNLWANSWKMNPGVILLEDTKIDKSVDKSLAIDTNGNSFTGTIELTKQNATFEISYSKDNIPDVEIEVPYYHEILESETEDNGIVTKTYVCNEIIDETNAAAMVVDGDNISYFKTLDNAFAECVGTSGKKIVLLKDVSSSNMPNPSVVTDMILDFNGHKLNIAMYNKPRAMLTVTFVDESESKNGKITKDFFAYGGFCDYHNFVIKAGTWPVDPENYTKNGKTYNFMAEGYTTEKNNGGTYTVVVKTSDKTEVDLTAPVIEISATVYVPTEDGEPEAIVVKTTLEDPEFTDENDVKVESGIFLKVELVETDAVTSELWKDYLVFDISFVDENGKEVTFAGSAKVTIPYTGSDYEDYRVYYIDSEGKLKDTNAVYDAVNKVFEFETTHFSEYTLLNYANIFSPNAYIQFKETSNPNEYEIYAVANDGESFNRLSSAQLQFELVNAPTNKTGVSYTIESAENVSLTAPDADGYWLFNFNGKVKDSGVTSEVLLGKVVFDGYGAFSFKAIDTASKAMVHTAELVDNVVVDYTVGGADYNLYVSGNGNDINAFGTGDFGGIIDGEFYVPRKGLEVIIDFNNAVEKQVADYQDMTVVVSGGDLENAIEIELGKADLDEALTIASKPGAKYTVDTSVDNKYTVNVLDTLTVDTTYTVTVKGAGYRTIRKNVTMTEDKTVNFWNNVKDVEGADYLAGDIVKDSSINIYDLSAVVSYFGTINDVDEESTYAKYDLNRDGKIDSKDVAYVLVSWGK